MAISRAPAVVATFALLVSLACTEKTKSGPPLPRALAVAASTATAPAAPGAPPVSEARVVRCTDVLSPGDILAACGVTATLATRERDLDDIGPGRSCSRRFASSSGQSVSFLITLFDDPTTAERVYDETTTGMISVEAIAGLGDHGRRYTKARGDDMVFNVELLKGKLNALLFSARVPSGPHVAEPLCGPVELEKLARALVAHLP